MTIWLTSDQHFNHNRDFIYEPKGFKSVDEATEISIARWNKVVKPNDTVYCLGDLALSGDLEKITSIIKRLNGTIILIRGNHDNDTRVELYKSLGIKVYERFYNLKFGGRTFHLEHYDNPRNYNSTDIFVHGHTHSPHKFCDKPNLYNVAVNAHNSYPVSIDTVLNEVQMQEEQKRIKAANREF